MLFSVIGSSGLFEQREIGKKETLALKYACEKAFPEMIKKEEYRGIETLVKVLTAKPHIDLDTIELYDTLVKNSNYKYNDISATLSKKLEETGLYNTIMVESITSDQNVNEEFVQLTIQLNKYNTLYLSDDDFTKETIAWFNSTPQERKHKVSEGNVENGKLVFWDCLALYIKKNKIVGFNSFDPKLNINELLDIDTANFVVLEAMVLVNSMLEQKEEGQIDGMTHLYLLFQFLRIYFYRTEMTPGDYGVFNKKLLRKNELNDRLIKKLFLSLLYFFEEMKYAIISNNQKYETWSEKSIITAIKSDLEQATGLDKASLLSAGEAIVLLEEARVSLPVLENEKSNFTPISNNERKKKIKDMLQRIEAIDAGKIKISEAVEAVRKSSLQKGFPEGKGQEAAELLDAINNFIEQNKEGQNMAILGAKLYVFLDQDIQSLEDFEHLKKFFNADKYLNLSLDCHVDIQNSEPFQIRIKKLQNLLAFCHKYYIQKDGSKANRSMANFYTQTIDFCDSNTDKENMVRVGEMLNDFLGEDGIEALEDNIKLEEFFKTNQNKLNFYESFPAGVEDSILGKMALSSFHWFLAKAINLANNPNLNIDQAYSAQEVNTTDTPFDLKGFVDKASQCDDFIIDKESIKRLQSMEDKNKQNKIAQALIQLIELIELGGVSENKTLSVEEGVKKDLIQYTEEIFKDIIDIFFLEISNPENEIYFSNIDQMKNASSISYTLKDRKNIGLALKIKTDKDYRLAIFCEPTQNFPRIVVEYSSNLHGSKH